MVQAGEHGVLDQGSGDGEGGGSAVQLKVGTNWEGEKHKEETEPKVRTLIGGVASPMMKPTNEGEVRGCPRVELLPCHSLALALFILSPSLSIPHHTLGRTHWTCSHTQETISSPGYVPHAPALSLTVIIVRCLCQGIHLCLYRRDQTGTLPFPCTGPGAIPSAPSSFF